MVAFEKNMLWGSKIQTEISIYTLNCYYVVLSHSIIYLFPMKILIKELVENLVMDSKNIKFVSISTIYEEDNIATAVETIPRMTY